MEMQISIYTSYNLVLIWKDIIDLISTSKRTTNQYCNTFIYYFFSAMPATSLTFAWEGQNSCCFP